MNMTVLRNVSLFTLFLLIAASCSSQGTDLESVTGEPSATTVPNPGSDQESANGTRLSIDPIDGIALDDQGRIGYCSPEEVGLLRLPDDVSVDYGAIADELQGPEVWASTVGAIDSQGTFELNEGFDEASLEGTLEVFYLPDRADAVNLEAPPAVSIDAVAKLHHGADISAPVFGAPSTLARLSEISVQPGDDLLLGLVWNGTLSAWGILSAWYGGQSGEILNVGDCGVLLTRDLNLFRDEIYPESSPRTVLLSAPFDVADRFSYGDQNEVAIDPEGFTTLGRVGRT